MKVISLMNMKGGVAKTTSTQNIAAKFTLMGKKVLVIDWDPQGDITFTYFDREDVKKTTSDMAKGEKIENCIIKTKEFDLIPNWDECQLSQVIGSKNIEDRAYVLSDALANLKGYDYVFVDCPPTEGDLPLNAIVASDYIFIPTTLEDLPIKQTENTIHLINKVKKRGMKVKIGGIFPTRMEKRLSIHKDNLEFLKEKYSEYLMNTVIPSNIKLAELPRVRASIFTHAPKSAGAKAYEELSKEILEVVK